MRKPLTICGAALFSLALTGCEPTPRTICPALKTYTAGDQAKLATDFRLLPDEARRMIDDYRLLRRQCRAIAR